LVVNFLVLVQLRTRRSYEKLTLPKPMENQAEVIPFYVTEETNSKAPIMDCLWWRKAGDLEVASEVIDVVEEMDCDSSDNGGIWWRGWGMRDGVRDRYVVERTTRREIKIATCGERRLGEGVPPI
jgi:hypothetical protein